MPYSFKIFPRVCDVWRRFCSSLRCLAASCGFQADRPGAVCSCTVVICREPSGHHAKFNCRTFKKE